MELKNQIYIGDGIYAGFDGYSIWIWTSNGISNSEKIAVEPEILSKLKEYLEENRNKNNDN